MFSWTDYFDANSGTEMKNNEKILGKSNSCKLSSQSTLPNGNRAKNRDCKSKLNPNNSSNIRSIGFRNKSNCKILDLSPEEKEKLAKLIKELGQLQSEKEQISNKLFVERNEYQLKLQSFQQMHNLTLQEKIKVEDELRLKEEKLRILEAQIKFDNKMQEESKCEKAVDKLLPLPHKNVKVKKSGSSVNSAYPVYDFPGPPKSSRTQEIKEELIRTHSRHSNDRIRSKQHKQLTMEHERLLIEKQYLDVVLKQQKCLNHLKKKIKKLEDRNNRENNSSCVQSRIEEDNSSRSQSITSFTPKVLNEASDDQSSVGRSISVPVVPSSGSSIGSGCSRESNGCKDGICKTERARNEIYPVTESMILRDDDLYLLSALNKEQIKTDSPYYLPVFNGHLGIASLKCHSPTDSLFEIISDLEDIDSSKCDFSNKRNYSIENLSDKEIIDDLFFNRLFY